MSVNAPPEPFERFAPESAPSELTAPEPSVARTVGMTGLGLAAVGVFAVYMNRPDTPRLIGPALGSFITLVGLAMMLYHAARDPDRLVRRGYIGAGIAALACGAVLSLLKQPSIGDWFVPWGSASLILALVFLLAGGRWEDETPWDGLVSGLLAAAGVGATATGFVGVAVATPDYVPRLAGVAILGLMFWWAAIARLGPANDRGYRLGQLLGLVGAVALLFAVGRSAGPPLLHAAGALTQTPDRFFIPRGLVLTSLGTMALMLAYAVCSDRPVVAMTRRELAAYFYSPIAYLVLLGTAFVGWLTYIQFVGDLIDTAGRARQEPIVSQYIVSIVPVFAIMFVVPVITMRLLSEEKRTGTLEVLLTSPVGEVSVVLSKFLAALIYFLVLVIPWGLFLIPVYNEGKNGFDYLPLLSFYVALLSSGAAFVSMGLFFSSLTRNQIVAAALTFAGMVAYLSLYFVAFQATGATKSVLEQFSFVRVWFNALGGKLYLHNVLTYLSVTVFWLFLTVKVLEARKWS